MSNQPRFIIVDPKSSQVKQFDISLPRIVLISLMVIFLIGVSFIISVKLIAQFSHNSRIAQLEKENSVLVQRLKQMNEKIVFLRQQVNRIEELDDKLRASLDVPPIDADVRQVGIGGSEITTPTGVDLTNPALESMILNNETILDRLDREIKLEFESYKKLLSTLERKEDSLRFLPAIKPVPNGRLTDGFGKRRHPIFKRIMFHKGIDLAASRGTPVLAPADGYVTFTGRNGGYGLFVTINHKYGFETKYGHLQKIYVRRGQFVKRGDKIGEVGNTGLSTAPHLHYEVLYKGKNVNPRNYYFDDIQFN